MPDTEQDFDTQALSPWQLWCLFLKHKWSHPPSQPRAGLPTRTPFGWEGPDQTNRSPILLACPTHDSAQQFLKRMWTDSWEVEREATSPSDSATAESWFPGPRKGSSSWETGAATSSPLTPVLLESPSVQPNFPICWVPLHRTSTDP